MNEGTVPFTPENMEDKPVYHNPHDTVSMVAEFEAACGARLYTINEVPPVEKLKLRLSLELEELYEKAQAMGLEQTFCWMLSDKSQVDIGRESYGLDSSIKDTGIYDPVALLDACADQRYVQDGTMLTCGLDQAFPEAFAEVQRSNMSKFPSSYKEATQTVNHYEALGSKASFSAPHPWRGAYVVKRVHDGKVLKSINYSPANLAPIIEKYKALVPNKEK